MKQTIKNFNNLIKKTIFKVKNKTNNNFKISNFNKYLITFVGLLFFYLFYLLIPLLYDKTWVQTSIENKILNEFKIKLSSSADISYRILPAPHFLIKDSIILINDNKKLKSISEIKNLKVFISQKNFLEKEKMNITKIVISNANFSLLHTDFKILNESSNNQLSKKKIKIYDSNIFFKDMSDEVTSIVKIDSAILFFEDKELLNVFSLKGETFAVPFTFNFTNKIGSIQKKEININVESLNLNISNKSENKNNNYISGINIISILNTTINTKYNIKDKLITFMSDKSKIKNSKLDYKGEMSISPFDLNIIINLEKYVISKLLNMNSILVELIKSKLLFNENISIKGSIIAKSKKKGKIFQNIDFSFHIINGIINLDNTRFVNDNIGLVELNNSNLFVRNNNLILSTNMLIKIKNPNRLFSFLNTAKKSRKDIKNILINLDYNISTNQIEFNNIKVDNNNVNNELISIIDGFSDNNINNLTRSRVLINKLLYAYEG